MDIIFDMKKEEEEDLGMGRLEEHSDGSNSDTNERWFDEGEGLYPKLLVSIQNAYADPQLRGFLERPSVLDTVTDVGASSSKRHV
ncbi:MAG: hypothetical protein PHZ00_00180 [Candidatus Peribacteraceae bacterium]|nr:hypothetical protein [Candidatus Peribacteraceae bacterium]